MEWITEVWNNEGEIEIWGSKPPPFKVLTIFVSLEFSVRGGGFWWTSKGNPAKQNFHIRWRFSSFQEGVRVAKKH